MTDLDSLAAQLEELNAVQQAAQEPEESSPVKTRKKQKKEKKDEPKPEKKSRKAVIALILIIVLLLGLVGGVLWYFLVYNAKSPLEKESEALGGLLAGKTPAEQQDILNEKVKEGRFCSALPLNRFLNTTVKKAVSALKTIRQIIIPSK